jgi:hypothetical protein
MERKRYFFKLEMERLPDNIWLQVKSTKIVRNMHVKDKLEIASLIEKLPDSDFDNLRATVRKIRDETDLQYIKENLEESKTLLLAALSEKDGWLSAEEDEAWKDL